MRTKLKNNSLTKIKDGTKMILNIFFALIGTSPEYDVDYHMCESCSANKSHPPPRQKRIS